MCGKFTAMASWSEVFAFSQPLIADTSEGSNDSEVTRRTFGQVHVILFNKDARRREIVQMRWGWPDPKNYKRPKHFHARGETIDTTRAFAPSFIDGRRGIVLMKTFNETPYQRDTEQWTIDPRDGRARGIAFVCQGFDIEGSKEKLLACVMVTVRANELLRESIMKGDDDPRMPAILEDDDWATWLGENDAPLAQVKSVLRTMEGSDWHLAPEPPKPPKPKTSKPKKPRGEPGLF